MRPPAVSLYFFAAALAILAYGYFVSREAAPVEDLGSVKATPVAAAAERSTATNDNVFPDFAWRFNALDPGIVTASATAAAFDPADDYWGLPRDDGVDLVAGYCAACHSLRIVMQQRASETRWRELMVWMIEKQGMAEPPDDDLEAIIHYLSNNFGV